MNCSCIKKSDLGFSVYVKTLSEDLIVILDTSDWNTESGYALPKSYKAVLSNDEVEKEIELIPLMPTYVTSEQAGFKFCDGVYCITTEPCGIKFTRRFAILEKAFCGIIKVSMKKDVATALELKSLADSIDNFARFNDLAKAQEYYTILKKYLSLYECNC